MVFVPAFGVISLGATRALVGGIAGKDGTLADAAIARRRTGLRLGEISGQRIDGPRGVAKLHRLGNRGHIHDGIVGSQRPANSRRRLARDR